MMTSVGEFLSSGGNAGPSPLVNGRRRVVRAVVVRHVGGCHDDDAFGIVDAIIDGADVLFGSAEDEEE
jgi:hypothetical protein